MTLFKVRLPVLVTYPVTVMLDPAQGKSADLTRPMDGAQGMVTWQFAVLVTVEKINKSPIGSVPFATTELREGLAVAKYTLL